MGSGSRKTEERCMTVESKKRNPDLANDYFPVDKKLKDPRDNYARVKFGFLGAEMGSLAKAYRQIHMMAFDEAYEQGWLNRRVEVVAHDENGLPLGTAQNVVEGFRWLVDQGC